MTAIDISEVLKAKFIGKPIKTSNGFTFIDGQVQQRCPCPPDNCCDILYEAGYAELAFKQMEVTYGEPQRSSLPADIVRRRWILENNTDVPDKKSLGLTLSFTETIVAGVSKTITQGRSSTFSANASYDFAVYGKYSFGYTETIKLDVQTATSRNETRTKVQTETYDFGYEIPPRTAAIIDLSKELVSYNTPFKASFIVDGFIVLAYTVLKKGVTIRDDADRRWGKISDYLSEAERTIVIDGFVGETAGETTRRSTKFEPLKPDVAPNKSLAELTGLASPCRFAIAERAGFKTAAGAAELGMTETASITLLSINAFEDGQFDVTFGVSTYDCEHSSCAGFNGTLVLEKDGVQNSVFYSFGGWSIAEGNGSYFTITRSGIEAGLLVDVIAIESPTIVCDDRQA